MKILQHAFASAYVFHYVYLLFNVFGISSQIDREGQKEFGTCSGKTAMFKTKLINQTKSRQITKLIEETKPEKE